MDDENRHSGSEIACDSAQSPCAFAQRILNTNRCGSLPRFVSVERPGPPAVPAEERDGDALPNALTSVIMEQTHTEAGLRWWGQESFEVDQAGRWRIGPTTLWAFRTRHDWRLLYESSGDPMQHNRHVKVPASTDRWRELEEVATTDPTLTVHRHTFRETPDMLTVEPILADRSIVVRPEHPLSVPAAEEVMLYLSTPLWIRLRAGDVILEDLPSHRPSDTWFGPSPREGELCYATRTAGRLTLSKLPMRAHRAVTPLTVRNQAAENFPLERVHVPTPYLALYESDAGAADHLWTQGLTLTRESVSGNAEITIRQGPPEGTKATRKLSGPRKEARSGLVVNTFRAIEGLFGGP